MLDDLVQGDDVAVLRVDVEEVRVVSGGVAVADRLAWHVRIGPFPFGDGPARFSLLRRVLPKRSWGGQQEFQDAFFGAAPERVEILIEGT